MKKQNFVLGKKENFYIIQRRNRPSHLVHPVAVSVALPHTELQMKADLSLKLGRVTDGLVSL